MPAETHVQQGPIERPEVLQLVKDRLADILEVDPSTIDEGVSFAEDLHADSLALIELVAKTFGTAKRDVTLIAGETSRIKRLAIAGDASVLARIAAEFYGAGHDG